MDLALSDEQRLLMDSARRFLSRACPLDSVRAAESSEHGHSPELWQAVADMGWPGLCLPERYGGTGASILDLALLAEELGYAAFPSPLLTSTTLVALPVAVSGSPAQQECWLGQFASGRVVGTDALLDPGAVDEWAAPTLCGSRSLGAWILEGRKILVPWAASSRVFTVLADLDGAGPTALLLAADRVGPIVRHHTLGGEPLYSVAFSGVSVSSEDILGIPGDGQALLARHLDQAAVVAAAQAVGLGTRALELSVEHARGRHQFGRPIGSFQAVAHRCADMRSDLDAARWLCRQAAWALGSSREPELAVAAAKAYTNDAIRRVFLNAHQVHGAIGFSMECDLQLFTRRAKAFEITLGSSAFHRRQVASRMGLSATAVVDEPSLED